MRSPVTLPVTHGGNWRYAVKNRVDTAKIPVSWVLGVCAARRSDGGGTGGQAGGGSSPRLVLARSVEACKINMLAARSAASRTAASRTVPEKRGITAISGVLQADQKSAGVDRIPPRGRFSEGRSKTPLPPKRPAVFFRGVPPHRFAFGAKAEIDEAAGARTLAAGGGVGERPS